MLRRCRCHHHRYGRRRRRRRCPPACSRRSPLPFQQLGRQSSAMEGMTCPARGCQSWQRRGLPPNGAGHCSMRAQIKLRAHLPRDDWLDLDGSWAARIEWLVGGTRGKRRLSPRQPAHIFLPPSRRHSCVLIFCDLELGGVVDSLSFYTRPPSTLFILFHGAPISAG